MSRSFFPCRWSNSEKIASNTGRYSVILDIVLEDGEAESDQDLDIDQFSDDESIINYEEEDNF